MADNEGTVSDEETAPHGHIRFLLEEPLYSTVVTTAGALRDLREQGVQFDAHCVSCKRESTFKSIILGGKPVPHSLSDFRSVGSPTYMKPGIFNVTAVCQRNDGHVYRFFMLLGRDMALTKIGQWPSIEDIVGGDIAHLRGVLSPERFRDLRRATGLASHGIGAGAFVYLRRIFEGLITEHYQLLKEGGQDVEGFDTMRMDEKVRALSPVLPNAVVENRSAYAILSVGIHELDEDTCKSFFPVVRRAIIMILQDDLRKKQERDDAKKLKEEMGAILGAVKAMQGKQAPE